MIGDALSIVIVAAAVVLVVYPSGLMVIDGLRRRAFGIGRQRTAPWRTRP